MKTKTIVLSIIVSALAGCSTQTQRLAQCEQSGVSKDACYIAEQNRQTSINNAAEKQALENAAQLAQSTHKHLPKGCTQVQDANGECNTTTATKASSNTKDAEYVMNKPISDAAEYLLSKGWKPNQGDWHKGSYILRLVVEDEKVVNSQLTK